MTKEINLSTAYEEFFQSDKTFQILKGSAGSGKSYAAALKILYLFFNDLDFGCLILRKTKSSSKNSTEKLIIDLIEYMGLSYTIKHNKHLGIIKSNINSNFILFEGAQDVERLKSISGITCAWLEESTEFSLSDFNQITVRIRTNSRYEDPNGKLTYGVKTYTKRRNHIILTLNPVSENHWIKKELWDSTDDDIFKTTTTYKDNAYLTEQYIKILESYNPQSNQYRVYTLGEWGIANSDSLMFSNFNTSNIFDTTVRKENLVLSFDFNVHPYCTLLVGVLLDEEIYIIDEFTATSSEAPFELSQIEKLVDKFSKRYSNSIYSLVVTGDASGQNRNWSGTNPFSVVQNSLTHYGYKLKMAVKTSNPSIQDSASFVNLEFQNNQLRIHDKCKLLIEDVSNMKFAPDGGKLIIKEKKEDGVTYEKYGHFSDCLRYIVIYLKGQEYQNYINSNKKVYAGGQVNLKTNPYSQTKKQSAFR